MIKLKHSISLFQSLSLSFNLFIFLFQSFYLSSFIFLFSLSSFTTVKFGLAMSTEWDSIQRRFGNLPSQPQELTVPEETLEHIIVQRAQLQQLYQLQQPDYENEEDDIEALEQYRLARLAELRAEANKEHFGSLRQISAAQFADEVTNAGKDIWVVLLLFTHGSNQCDLLERILCQLTLKFPVVKFRKILSSDCIREYPEENLPTLLIYYEGQVKHKFIGLKPFGGQRLTCDDVEWELSKVGVLETELDEDPRATMKNRIFINIQKKNVPRMHEEE